MRSDCEARAFSKGGSSKYRGATDQAVFAWCCWAHSDRVRLADADRAFNAGQSQYNLFAKAQRVLAIFWVANSESIGSAAEAREALRGSAFTSISATAHDEIARTAQSNTKPADSRGSEEAAIASRHGVDWTCSNETAQASVDSYTAQKSDIFRRAADDIECNKGQLGYCR